MKIKTIIFLGCIALASCARGDGVPRTEARDGAGFERVILAMPGQTIITRGPEHAIEVRADRNLIAGIKTRVMQQTLYVEAREQASAQTPQVVRVTTPLLRRLVITGGGAVEVVDVEAPSLELEVIDDAQVKLSGAVGALQIKTSDRAQIKAFALEADEVKVRVTQPDWVRAQLGDGGVVEVSPGSLLEVSMKAGLLRYNRDPQRFALDVAPEARVEPWAGAAPPPASAP